MKSLQGHLLIAAPTLLDPNFYHSVVLIVHHNDEQVLGLVLNRQLETTIDMVWPTDESPCLLDSPLYQGGPCEGMLMVLHSDAMLSDTEVLPGVYFSNDKESIQQLVGREDSAASSRYFVGYAGWGDEQLENELQSGAWLVSTASAEQVFGPAEKLWTTLRRRISLQKLYPSLDPSRIPDDPGMN